MRKQEKGKRGKKQQRGTVIQVLVKQTKIIVRKAGEKRTVKKQSKADRRDVVTQALENRAKVISKKSKKRMSG